jgi:hypothetical protein
MATLGEITVRIVVDDRVSTAILNLLQTLPPVSMPTEFAASLEELRQAAGDALETHHGPEPTLPRPTVGMKTGH